MQSQAYGAHSSSLQVVVLPNKDCLLYSLLHSDVIYTGKSISIAISFMTKIGHSNQ